MSRTPHELTHQVGRPDLWGGGLFAFASYETLPGGMEVRA